MSDTEPTEISIEPQPDPAPKRARTTALLLGIVAVLAGGIFAGTQLAADENAPEDPVRDMLAAVEQGDVLGVLEQLEPGERDALRDPVADLVAELNRLEVLDADLRSISGVDVTFADLELESKQVRDDIASVRITGGEGTIRVDPAELPLGDFLEDLLGDVLEGAEPTSDTSEMASGDGDEVTTVKRDGRWYVSIGYSVAETARRAAGVDIDDLPEGVAPDGADSPEAAVRAMVEAATDLDARRAISLLSPGEFGALQEYAGLFLDEAEEAVDELGDDVDIEVTTLDLDSETSGDHATVFVRELEFRASAAEGSVAYEDGCFSTDIEGESQEICPGDQVGDAFGGNLFGQFGLGEIAPPDLSFDDASPEYGVATVQVGGKWYVAPIRTGLDALVETVRLFEPADLRELQRFFGDVIDGLQEAATGGFTTFGTCAAMTPDGAQPCEDGVGFDMGIDPEALDACMDDATSADEAEACFELPTTTVP